jgi:hypothetical protein
MSIIGLLVFLIVVGLVFWVIRTLASTLAIPAPIVTVLQVILVVVVVLYLLDAFGLWNAGLTLRLR